MAWPQVAVLCLGPDAHRQRLWQLHSSPVPCRFGVRRDLGAESSTSAWQILVVSADNHTLVAPSRAFPNPIIAPSSNRAIWLELSKLQESMLGKH